MNFNPGWFPSTVVLRGGNFIQQVLSATSTGASIVAPAGIENGDLLVYLDTATGVIGAPLAVVPTGFTQINNASISTTRQIVSYKFALGSEGGTTLTGMNDIVMAKEFYVFRRVPRAGSVTLSPAIGAQVTAGDPVPQTVLAASGAAPLVVFGCYGTNGAAIDPRNFNPSKDGELSAATFSYLAYKIYSQGPENVLVDMDDEDTNILQSFYIEMGG